MANGKEEVELAEAKESPKVGSRDVTKVGSRKRREDIDQQVLVHDYIASTCLSKVRGE